MNVDEHLPAILSESPPLALRAGDQGVEVQVGPALSARLRLVSTGDAAVALALVDLAAPVLDDAVRVVLAALHAVFGWRPAVRRVSLELGARAALADHLCRVGVAGARSDADGGVRVDCLRSAFWQHPALWLAAPTSAGFPLAYTVSEGKRHPRRPRPLRGTVYRRRVPELGATVSFRTIDPVRDLAPFHRWMNDPRVARFWEMPGSEEEHTRYMQRSLEDAHLHPVIGCFDDEPFGYFELYWAKEDRIAPFYDVDDYDRGLHMLVGEQRWRGPTRVAAWLTSLAHYLFLDDPRTRNVVAEPRADNATMIGYLGRAGFFREKEFDFPHKRAAMMVLRREVFFDERAP